jgi:hypothetical protein
MAGWRFTASGIVNSRAKVTVVASAVLLIAGAALRPVEESLRKAESHPGRLVRARRINAVLVGQGTSMAMLGGFRALVADLLWLKAYLAWSACDLPATETMIRVVTTVDERPLCFWLNGARIMAYDMTQWRLRAVGRGGAVPAALRQRIINEQAGMALRLLEDARGQHPQSAAVYVEMANIHLNSRADPAAAAFWYRQAATLPDAPYYAARIHAELLNRLGRPWEAYAWLRQLHPTLPPGEEAAEAPVVLGRIRDLERALEVPEKERYVAPKVNAIAQR